MGCPRLLAAALLLALVGSACEGGSDDGWQPGARQVIPLCTGLSASWKLVPHRLSLLEIGYEQRADAAGGTLSVRNDGGTWGSMPGELGLFEYGLDAVESTHLAARRGSLTVEIPPAAEAAGTPFEAAAELVLPAAGLEQASALAALISGVALSTDEYDTPPAFETDPDLPYDPAVGYTTQGLGIRLDPPERRGDEVVVPVAVRNSLGLADRGDMNAAIPQATTWLTVDVQVVGAFGAGAAATRGSTGYFIGNPEYGQNTVHPHASEDEQRIQLAGAPGPAAAVFGLAGFDLWLNQEGHGDPACTVVSDPTNFDGEPISGPGRYVRELNARIGATQYDAASGRGEALLDLFLTNSSTFKEIGNVCLEARGEVAMIQLDDPTAARRYRGTLQAEAVSGTTATKEATY